MLSSDPPSWGDKGKTEDRAREALNQRAGESHTATAGHGGGAGPTVTQPQRPGQSSVGAGDWTWLPKPNFPAPSMAQLSWGL